MKKLFFVLIFLAAAVVSYAQDVPSDYPKDLPKPVSAKFISSSSELGAVTYTFESELSPQAAFDSLKADMEKNKFVMNSQGNNVMSDAGGMVNWAKDDKIAFVVFSRKDDKITTIVIAYK
ncbi:MAG: hypothetical protein JST55_15425 [Bacteroidetes bacterium]|nr:hypothetical protein [Bacteroidota bacterium]